MTSPSRAVVSLWRGCAGWNDCPRSCAGVAAGDEDMRPGGGGTGRAAGRARAGHPPDRAAADGSRARLGRNPARPRGALVADPAHRGQLRPEHAGSRCCSWGPGAGHALQRRLRPAPGQRHPAALGRRVADVWTDVWTDIEPHDRRGLRRARDLLRGPAADHDAGTASRRSPTSPSPTVPSSSRAGRSPACSTPSSRRPSGCSPPAGWASCSGWAACRARSTASTPQAVAAALRGAGRRPGRLPVRARLPPGEARHDAPLVAG